MGKQSADVFRERVRAIEARAAGSAEVTIWTPEQINQHLARIGPDKNWDKYYGKKDSQLAITAPRERLGGGYFKPGESW